MVEKKNVETHPGRLRSRVGTVPGGSNICRIYFFGKVGLAFSVRGLATENPAVNWDEDPADHETSRRLTLKMDVFGRIH